MYRDKISKNPIPSCVTEDLMTDNINNRLRNDNCANKCSKYEHHPNERSNHTHIVLYGRFTKNGLYVAKSSQTNS